MGNGLRGLLAQLAVRVGGMVLDIYGVLSSGALPLSKQNTKRPEPAAARGAFLLLDGGRHQAAPQESLVELRIRASAQALKSVRR